MPSFRPLLAAFFTAACASAPASPALAPAAPASPASTTPSPAPIASASPSASTAPKPSAFECTEVIGLTITAEWYGAGFEQLVDDARFQARTRPHTFVDQWADPTHVAWSEPVSSPCATASDTPDRVVLFAANWKLENQGDWTKFLEGFVSTAKQRYPELKALELFTVLRGPRNQTCGDPKSVVDPMIDAAIAKVAAAHPELVHAGPKLEAADCSVFEKGGPHFTAEGRKLVAAQLAATLRPTQ
jgi:hypothetical protein